MTSLCQGLRRSASSGGEDPENQVGQDYCIVLELTQLNSIPHNWAGQDKTRQDKPLN